MDLGDVMHRRDTAINLAQPAEQFVDVHVLWTVDGHEFAENELELVDRPVRLAVVEQQPVREEAAQRRLELVMMCIDEARHDNASPRINHSGAAGAQVGTNGHDFLPLDQHVGLGEIAHLRVHRHHMPAASHIAPA